VDTLDYLYKEYVRQNEALNVLALSSFSDFKLLAVLGVMITWEPLSKALAMKKEVTADGGRLLFGGFVALLFVLIILATRDLLKQSIISFQITQIRELEISIRPLLSQTAGNVFHGADAWDKWLVDVHHHIFIDFQLLFIFISVFFPVWILWNKNKIQATAYLGICAFVFGIYFHATWFLVKNH